MKKILILFAIIAVGMTAIAQAQQPMALVVSPYGDKDTTAKVQGIDNTHFVVYFGKEVNDKIKDIHYFLVLRRNSFDLKTLELYYGTAGSPLVKVDASFARNPDDYDNSIVTSKAIGTISFIRRLSPG